MVKASPLSHTNCNLPREQCKSKTKSKEQNQKLPQHMRKQHELRTLYQKLREIIPSCHNKPVSSLDIVLHAVEYINELHQALEEEYPGIPKPIPNLNLFKSNLVQNSTKTSQSSIRDVTNMTLASSTRSPIDNIRN